MLRKLPWIEDVPSESSWKQGMFDRTAITCFSRIWRISAIKNSAPKAHGLWRASTPNTTKRSALSLSFYLSPWHVIGPIMSAAEAILYTASDWEKFDKVTEGL